MRKFIIAVAALALSASASTSFAQGGKGKTKHSNAGAGTAHVILTPGDVKWGPAPPALPPGAEVAVIDGDPSKRGAPYTIRLKVPDGYRVAPHWHPVDESVTVIEGTLVLGLGDKFDESAGRELMAGSYARMPKGVRHFASMKGESIIQVHGTGPFEIIYVNPADDPRHKSGK